MSGCARCNSPLEDGDLRCAVCALPAPASAAPAAERARVLRCRECNAAVAFSPDAQAPRCAFCGAVMAVEQPIDPVEAARLRVPFAVDRAAATASLRGWLGRRGFFAPRALANEAVVDTLAPLYWAGWIVDARVGVTWAADSNADAWRSTWAPHSGAFVTECTHVLIPASRGLSTRECVQLTPFYDLGRAVPVAADAPAPDPLADGAVLEGFDAQRSAARALVHENIEALAAVRAEAHIPGSRFRHVRVSCLIESQTTERIALPAWVMAYRWRGAVYRAVVHGQRDGVVVGSAPLDRGKIALLVAAGAALVVAILAVVHFARH